MQWRDLTIRYVKLAIVYRAASVRNAVIAWTRQLSDMPLVLQRHLQQVSALDFLPAASVLDIGALRV